MIEGMKYLVKKHSWKDHCVFVFVIFILFLFWYSLFFSSISCLPHLQFSLISCTNGQASMLWRKRVTAIASEYPDIELSHMYVDNAAMQLVRYPKQVCYVFGRRVACFWCNYTYQTHDSRICGFDPSNFQICSLTQLWPIIYLVISYQMKLPWLLEVLGCFHLLALEKR